jgi:hypothetical protein
MSTSTIPSLLDHVRATRRETERCLELRARRDHVELALGRFIVTSQFTAFDRDMLRDFLMSLLAWCDSAGIDDFEEVLAEAERQFLELVDPT